MKSLTGIQVSLDYAGVVVACVFFRDGFPQYFRMAHRPEKSRRILYLSRTKFGPPQFVGRGGDVNYGDVVRYFYGKSNFLIKEGN